MSIGFRKSLFGFNTDDVINYVKKLHASFNEKEASFKEQISALDEKIEALIQNEKQLESEKAELNAQLEEYNSKKAEMDRLGENIGKLYLVAQTNSKTIMSNAEENSKIANEEVTRNVSAIEETHLALDNLRKSITETSENFNKEVMALMQSLEATKEKISADTKTNTEANEQFAALLEAVSK